MSLCSFFSEVVAASQHQPWIAEGETNFFLLAILVASGSQVTQILYWPVGWQNPDTTQMISEICYLLRVVKPSSVTKSLQHHCKITAKSYKIIQNRHLSMAYLLNMFPCQVWCGQDCQSVNSVGHSGASQFCWLGLMKFLLVGYS